MPKDALRVPARVPARQQCASTARQLCAPAATQGGASVGCTAASSSRRADDGAARMRRLQPVHACMCAAPCPPSRTSTGPPHLLLLPACLLRCWTTTCPAASSTAAWRCTTCLHPSRAPRWAGDAAACCAVLLTLAARARALAGGRQRAQHGAAHMLAPRAQQAQLPSPPPSKLLPRPHMRCPCARCARACLCPACALPALLCLPPEPQPGGDLQGQRSRLVH